MEHILLSPPVAFLILLGVSLGLSALSKRLAPRGQDTEKKLQSYACGETMEENQARPEYGEFFVRPVSPSCTSSPWWWPLTPAECPCKWRYTWGHCLGTVWSCRPPDEGH